MEVVTKNLKKEAKILQCRVLIEKKLAFVLLIYSGERSELSIDWQGRVLFLFLMVRILQITKH
jgi:hypothetical protein